jgi:hypothetical protein
MTESDALGLGLLALVLLGYWRLGRTWSRVPPARKPARRRLTDAEEARRLRRLLCWWLLWS